MSIDLDWHKLDASLAHTLVTVLNRQLTHTPRPSFIGPVEITGLDFGTAPPDVELVDLRDVHPDFLEDDDTASEPDNVKVTEGPDAFEWVPRRAGRGLAEDALAYHHLPPHVRYGRGPAADVFAPAALHPRDTWRAPTHAPAPPASRAGSPAPRRASPAPAQARPDLQLHLHLTWHANLRLTLATSLLINYPSPSFMSLPIKLSVTGLVFNGEVAVAYQGSRGRVHVCILDDLDPYGPACRRERSQSSTPSDVDDETGKRDGKRLPVGQRLLPSILIESEIGQADKHVLKNVTRVERFIQDVIRKTVEDELVFPNFHTLVMEQ